MAEKLKPVKPELCKTSAESAGRWKKVAISTAGTIGPTDGRIATRLPPDRQFRTMLEQLPSISFDVRLGVFVSDRTLNWSSPHVGRPLEPAYSE
jgi:hypothetical protein